MFLMNEDAHTAATMCRGQEDFKPLFPQFYASPDIIISAW